MKIVENTPDRLILGNTPWLLGLSMIAVILIFVGLGLNLVISGEILPGVMFAVVGGGLGGLAFVGFVRRTQLVLDAPGDTVTLRSRSMLGYKLREFRLSEVDSAFAEAPSDSDTKGVYRPVLLLKSAERVPILLAFTSGRGARVAAQAINDWMSVNGHDGLRRQV